MNSLYSHIQKKILTLKKANLERKLRLIKVEDKKNIIINGHKAICFSSNDYLGLSAHPEVILQTTNAIKQFGSGSGASRLISGNREYHILLEDKLSQLKNKERSLLFGSGYLANIALLPTLSEDKDLILSDSLNHASIIDGCRLSRAKVIDYPHNDMDWLKAFLKENRHNYKRVFIVSESIFSMDGDIVDLSELYNIANNYDAVSIIDEAHSTGVLGKYAKGIEEHYNLDNPNGIIMGTLSKALASYGAFVCGRSLLIDYLINRARSFIFSTALPSSCVISAYSALRLIEKDSSIYKSLRDNIFHLDKALKQKGVKSSSNTAIFPIIIGDSKTALDISSSLLSKGIYIQAIRYPTVPMGTARLRIVISAVHTKEQIDLMVNCLFDTLKSYNLLN